VLAIRLVASQLISGVSQRVPPTQDRPTPSRQERETSVNSLRTLHLLTITQGQRSRFRVREGLHFGNP